MDAQKYMATHGIERMSEHWTEGWTDVFCITHQGYPHGGPTESGACISADLAFGGEGPCVWSVGRVAFDAVEGDKTND
jgi:hypothetical protein